jgi:hypothetical protein
MVGRQEREEMKKQGKKEGALEEAGGLVELAVDADHAGQRALLKRDPQLPDRGGRWVRACYSG